MYNKEYRIERKMERVEELMEECRILGQYFEGVGCSSDQSIVIYMIEKKTNAYD